MRDRLIAILTDGSDHVLSIPIISYDGIEAIADHLLANGVIAPPVTIGQPVWKLCRWQHKETEIREGKVSMLQQKVDKSWKIRVSINSSVWDITIDEIGKTVFLTREEAEQAIKEKE